MKIGLTVRMTKDLEANFEQAKALGITSIQLVCWELDLYSPEYTERVIAAREACGLEISACWIGWSAPKIWNVVEGPLTLGLLPEAYRLQRIEDMKRGSDFAKSIGVNQVVTHVGFIPEQPHEQGYPGMICALREVAAHCKTNGQKFLFETGQETPFTLLRAIDDIGLDNLGVNFDPANLMLYGKANPLDALEVLAPYVCGVHAKDGSYPKGGRDMGVEYPVGEGKVNFPEFLRRLRALRYDGPLTIECEIKGEETAGVAIAAKRLREMLAAL